MVSFNWVNNCSMSPVGVASVVVVVCSGGKVVAAFVMISVAHDDNATTHDIRTARRGRVFIFS
jgi:hypothetical protein